jgi:glycosyltransferase involved in cell wall biosynthesis
MPDVTVVIPTRDRLALLEVTLSTVIEQAAAVIVVDDGSSDGTAERLRRLPVTVVRNDGPAWGSARARNAGIARAETDHVAFVDSDDLLLPRALARLAGAIEAAPFAYGCGLAAAQTPDGWVSEGLIAPLRGGDLRTRNPVPSSGVVANRAALDEVGGFDERLTYSEDHDLWLRLARLAAPAHVPELVVVHRRHPGNRHDQVRALRDEAEITRRAGATPERLGALLCEHAIQAVRARRPDELARAVRALWLPGPDRARILAAAARHQRVRRAAGAAGRRVLAERVDVREWLDAQPTQRA